MIAQPTQLPDPDTKPACDVVVWDGKCNFCREQVLRLRRMDAERLAYLSLHDPRTEQLCPNLSQAELLEQLWVITPTGEQYGGADAGRYLSRRLPKLWWLMPLLHLPFSMPLWRWLYRKIAERRYRISGKSCDNGSCELHQRK
ncbi:MAG: DUF393 domain-containing protein [Pirellulaceae bacterium]